MSDSMAPFWGEFKKFQAIVWGRPRLDPPDNLIVMHAREDALTAILDDFGDGAETEPFRRFGNLCRNRATKFRKRLELDREQVRKRGQRAVPEVVALRELVGMVRANVDPADWPLLWDAAQGRTGQEVAMRHGLTLASLRCRLARARRRVRESSVGGVVLRALVA